jgi:mono/diheme cytochrome c family protein
MNDESKSCSVASDGEPTATHSTVPVWIFALTLALLFLGGIYFDQYSGWFDANVYGPYVSANEVELYQPKSGAAALLAQGRGLYEKNCGICHQPDGMGKPGLFPPLAGSEWVNAKGINRLAQIPLEGLTGTIEVKGQQMTFPAGMVAIGAVLSDNDLAAVLSYIRGSWGNKAEPVDADDLKAIRAKIGAHPQPVSPDQLMKLPE